MAKSTFQEFTKGLWTEIPPYRLVLGLCPTLAMSKGVDTGFGMGVAVTFVLVCSNVLISVLRKLIPKDVRIACFIVVVATFVIVVELLMQAYTYPLFLQMGIFIPLIVVNCIPLGRAEPLLQEQGLASLPMDWAWGSVTMSLSSLAAIRRSSKTPSGTFR
jgi:electron transport complex protein RnfE